MPPVSSSYSILAISGSLRVRSSNTEALRAAASLAPASVNVTLYSGLGALPHFNPDLDGEGAVPPTPVMELRAQVAAADALLICSPEYAHGVPGVLKNALDWLVSGPEIVFKPIGLLNASPRSTHAQSSLAETLRTMSTVLVPEASISLPLGGRGLDAEAIIAMPELAEPLLAALHALVGAVEDYRQRRAELLGFPVAEPSGRTSLGAIPIRSS
jgi:NAD(P)H-dependent FMN reductase